MTLTILASSESSPLSLPWATLSETPNSLWTSAVVSPWGVLPRRESRSSAVTETATLVAGEAGSGRVTLTDEESITLGSALNA